MADAFLGFFEHPEFFSGADCFQISAGHTLIDFDRKTGIHRRTSYCAAHEVIRRVFGNSEIYNGTLDSRKLTDGVHAVSDEAVLKDGRMAITLTPLSISDYVRAGLTQSDKQARDRLNSI